MVHLLSERITIIKINNVFFLIIPAHIVFAFSPLANVKELFVSIAKFATIFFIRPLLSPLNSMSY